MTAMEDPQAGLRVGIVADREWMMVRPEGELDLATLPVLETAIEQLIAEGFGAIRLDLSGLSFIDSGGLHLVAGLARRHSEGLLRVQVLPGPLPVSRAFDLAGLTALVPFAPGSPPSAGRR